MQKVIDFFNRPLFMVSGLHVTVGIVAVAAIVLWFVVLRK
jgi:hypothetical protein